MGKADDDHTPESRAIIDDPWPLLEAVKLRIQQCGSKIVGVKGVEDALANERLRSTRLDVGTNVYQPLPSEFWKSLWIEYVEWGSVTIYRRTADPRRWDFFAHAHQDRVEGDFVYYVSRSDYDRLWAEQPLKQLEPEPKPASEPEPEPEPQLVEPEPEPEPKSKPKKWYYWDEWVIRALNEKFPGNSAMNYDAGHVETTVVEALASKIKESGRKPPSRALILRHSGHWKKPD